MQDRIVGGMVWRDMYVAIDEAGRIWIHRRDYKGEYVWQMIGTIAVMM